jgi:hypothetical protein
MSLAKKICALNCLRKLVSVKCLWKIRFEIGKKWNGRDEMGEFVTDQFFRLCPSVFDADGHIYTGN